MYIKHNVGGYWHKLSYILFNSMLKTALAMPPKSGHVTNGGKVSVVG